MWLGRGETASVLRGNVTANHVGVTAGRIDNQAVFSGQRQRSLIRHNPQRGLRARQV
jgi:hypothetical protein